MSALSEESLRQLHSIVLTQHDLLRRLRTAADAVQDECPAPDRFDDLDRLIAEVEANAAYLTEADVPDLPAPLFVAERRASVAADLTRLRFDSWESYALRARMYAIERGQDPLAPYEALLTTADWEQMQRESYDAQYRWDKWDYLIVGVAGALGALVDLLFIKTPGTSELTQKLKDFKFSPKTQQELEKFSKVSFDKGGVGWGGGNHRFQSLGHDPVLGFVVGIFDLITGRRSGFQFDSISKTFSWVSETTGDAGINILKAFMTQMRHLLSDVATKQGLPAPFMPLLQIDSGSIGQIAHRMYRNGYDLRHFLVGALTPAIIELIVRTYIFIRHWCEHGEAKFSIGGHPKYRSMLLWAHTIAAATNAGKVVFMQNPLAINWAEWQAFIRYLLPSVKYWLFDKQRLKREHMENIAEQGWRELSVASAALYERLAKSELQPVTLGTAQ